MFTRRYLAAALVATAAMLTTFVASATVLEELTLDEMTKRSDAIVHGVVVRSGTRLVMGDGGAEPHTLTTLRVLRWLKGSEGATGGTVTIRERGGEVNGRGMWIDGTPRYTANEEVVVFLERFENHASHESPEDAFRTFGMVQGKFQVRHGIGSVPASVTRDLDGVGLVRWAGDGPMQITSGGREPAAALETFVAYVSSIAGAR